MSLFDLRTAYLVMGFLYLLMPAIVWVALRGSRSDAVVAWCLGGFGLGFGVFVIATRGLAPDWFSLGLGNTLVAAGLALRVGACRRELGLPAQALAIGLATLCGIGLYELFRSVVGDLKLASTWVTFLQGVLAAYVASLAALLALKDRSLHAATIAFAYAMLGLSLFVRVFGLLQGWGNPNVWLNPRPTADLMFLSFAGVFVAVVSNVGYLALYFERARKSEVAIAVAKAARDASTRFAAQIARLEQHRSLGLVAMSLSHELTQPLAAIAVQARTAQRAASGEGRDTAGLVAALTRITDNAMRAGAIVERIRAFIRPEAREREPVELGALAREVAQLVEPDARAQGITLVFSETGSTAWVSGDRIPLSQVILNAYRNSIDAAQGSARREIHVSAGVNGGRAQFRVRDYGRGLTAEAVRHAGEPLFTTKDGGLGVGLAVSRALAEQHGGSLSLANVEGGGALFELDLPAIEAPSA